jgi:hypothetical protein
VFTNAACAVSHIPEGTPGVGSSPGHVPTAHESGGELSAVNSDVRLAEALLTTGALQRAIFNSANFSSFATDARGVIQIP